MSREIEAAHPDPDAACHCIAGRRHGVQVHGCGWVGLQGQKFLLEPCSILRVRRVRSPVVISTQGHPTESGRACSVLPGAIQRWWGYPAAGKSCAYLIALVSDGFFELALNAHQRALLIQLLQLLAQSGSTSKVLPLDTAGAGNAPEASRFGGRPGRCSKISC